MDCVPGNKVIILWNKPHVIAWNFADQMQELHELVNKYQHFLCRRYCTIKIPMLKGSTFIEIVNTIVWKLVFK